MITGVNGPETEAFPLSTPSLESVRPAGSPVADQRYGGVPPCAWSVVCRYAVWITPLGIEVVRMPNCGLTVSASVTAVFAPASASRTLTW